MAITSASIVRSSVFFRDHVPHISGIKVKITSDNRTQSSCSTLGPKEYEDPEGCRSQDALGRPVLRELPLMVQRGQSVLLVSLIT